MNKLYTTLAGILVGCALTAQVSVETTSFTISRSADFEPRKAEESFNTQLYSLEAPDAMHWRSQLNEIKVRAAERFTEVTPEPQRKKTAPQPGLGWTKGMFRVSPTGFVSTLNGGIPNDNTMAISKDSILVGAVNTLVWAYDLKTDTLHFDNISLDLDAIGPDENSDRGFDPKLMYDPEMDRFILVFLKNNTSATSKITVCFSSTNDPSDPWYTYILPGNPLNNDRWTDFPAMSITDDYLYITGNLIIPNVSWQVGFDGSIIWQLDKKAGFAGDANIGNRLHHDIRFGTKYIRNLHCVKGYNGKIDTAYFLSNRNFDIQNDSIFVLSLHSGLNETEDLRIGVRQSDLPYGVPPNGRQQDTDLSDPTDGLQTNDARVLGAIRMANGDIQFVSTTRNFSTQRAAIYHGILHNPGSSQSSITANLVSHPVRDYGYPNLAWSGNEECDNEVIIGFDHTSPTSYAGISAVYYSNDGDYSEVLQIKAGEGYVNRLVGGDRWGDYFGIQTMYHKPGTVYISGYYGTSGNKNSTYFAELTSPDEDKIVVTLNHIAGNNLCEQTVEAVVSGGVTPYTYSWNGSTGNSSITACGNDTLQLLVTDGRGCSETITYVVPFTIPNEVMLYPNPTPGQLSVVFESPSAGDVIIQISDLNGRVVKILEQTSINTGKHFLQFDLAPLKDGVYVLDIIMDEESIYTEKFIKRE